MTGHETPSARLLDWLFGDDDDFLNTPVAVYLLAVFAKIMLIGFVVCLPVIAGGLIAERI